MSMIICRECGKEISDKAEKCPNCGCPVHSNMNQIQKQNSKDGKTSGLSITALVFSILGCTFIIGMILAIIDLCKKDGRKKTCPIIALVICGMWFILAVASMGGSEESNDSAHQSISTSVESDKQKEDSDNILKEDKSKDITYSIGDTWTVDGQWNLTINSISETNERNQFSDKKAVQVFIIDYTYENLGYEDQTGLMDGLFFDLTNGQIVDSNGFMGYSYPVDITDYAKETPIGAKCKAQECIGVDNQSTEIKIMLSKHDGTGKEQEATFVLPIN